MTLNESDMEVSEQRHGNGTWLHAKLAHEAACLADAFDCISAGMFLVDASGRIVYTNAAGRLVLAAGDPSVRPAAGWLPGTGKPTGCCVAFSSPPTVAMTSSPSGVLPSR